MWNNFLRNIVHLLKVLSVRKLSGVFMAWGVLLMLVCCTLPHHHHHEVVCFSMKCQSECEAHHHHCEDPACEDENDCPFQHRGHTDNCDLFSFLQVPSSSNSDLLVTPVTSFHESLFCPFLAFVLSDGAEATSLLEGGGGNRDVPLRSHPDLRVAGFRAPPFCI